MVVDFFFLFSCSTKILNKFRKNLLGSVNFFCLDFSFKLFSTNSCVRFDMSESNMLIDPCSLLADIQ